MQDKINERVSALLQGHANICGGELEEGTCPICLLKAVTTSAHGTGMPVEIFLGLMVEILNEVWTDGPDLTMQHIEVPPVKEMH